MSFNDDEEIVATQNVQEDKLSVELAGLIGVKVVNKKDAPLEECKLKVMVEMTGSGSGKTRAGVDVVAVLDLSESMGRDKLEGMKAAMRFVIRKLSPLDRLSVVAFSTKSWRVCPLRQINEISKSEIEKQVNALDADGWTNIAAGLQTAQKVLGDRRFSEGRTAGIILMSDGHPNRGARKFSDVPTMNVAVHTFGFGAKHNPKVLKEIADRSLGGTFSDVSNSTILSIPFSQCLAGLLTVVVQDLKLSITAQKEASQIVSVSAGNYPQTKDADDSGAETTVTVSFGDLYARETRNVIVDLLLPAVSSRWSGKVVVIAPSYRVSTPKELEREEIIIEESRLSTARTMKEVRELADGNKLEDAVDKIVDAQNLLDDVVEEPHPLIEILKSELQYLRKLVEDKEIYMKEGLPFALSSETSHNRQRFAARGDVEKLRLFATLRMNTYLEQAQAFEKDPSKPLPTDEEDVKAEIIADPLASIVGPLNYYIQTAIQALKSIEEVLDSARR